MKRMIIAVLSCVGLVLCFQNCSSNNAGFAPGSADSASSAVANPTVSQPTTPPVAGDVLGLFNYADITRVHFYGKISIPVVGSFNSDTMIVLDHLQHSYSATLSASALSYLSLTCSSSGTLVNYNALETAMQALSFNTAPNSALPNMDFLTATLEITLKNGTIKTFTVDTNSNHLVIDHFNHIDATALKSFTRVLVSNAGCSY